MAGLEQFLLSGSVKAIIDYLLTMQHGACIIQWEMWLWVVFSFWSACKSFTVKYLKMPALCVSLVPKVISSELSVDNKFGAFEQHSGEEGRLIHRNFLMGVRLPLHKRFIEMSPSNMGLQLQSY